MKPGSAALRQFGGFVLSALGMLLACSMSANAQLQGLTGTVYPLGPATSTNRGGDASYDPVNQVYLAIGDYGPVRGIFLNASGAPVTAGFAIAPGYSNYARAQYSADLGGFLVAWGSEDTPGIWNLHVRVVAYPGTMGADTVLSDSEGVNGEAAPAVAYSPTSKRFLVAWITSIASLLKVKANLVSLTGAPIGAPLTVSSSGYGRDPGATWNPFRDEFGLSFSGEATSGGGYSVLALLPASAGTTTVRTRNTFNQLSGGLLTFITDLDYNPNTRTYLMGWFEFGAGSVPEARVAELDEDANQVWNGIASTQVGSYDSLSVALNPLSGTYLLAGTNGSSDLMLGAELNMHGVRLAGENTLSAERAWYVRVAPSQQAPQWLTVFSRQSGFIFAASLIGTSSVNGGSSTPGSGGSVGSTGACPGTAPFAGAVCVNGSWVPGSDGSTGGSTGGCPGTAPFAGAICVNGNWVPDTSGSSGSTGGCPGTAPFAGAVCVNGNWVPGTDGGSTGGCPGTQPFAGAICVNGNWVPGTGGSSGGSTSGCPGSAPFAGAVCVNGNWIPDSGGSTGGSTGGCPGTAPFAGAVCVNGNWIPGTGGGSTGGCPGTQPFAGAICVNGNWVPDLSGGGSTGNCPGSVPFAGAVCVNGNWIPGSGGSSGGSTSGCPGSVPFAGAVCVNGNWVPGTSSSSSLSGLPICTDGSLPGPVSGWVRIGLYDWVPPDYPTAYLATCRAQ